ncbi:MAG TPA: hypothetical protein VMC04_18395, partial [Verrucomicrobiae bacterium]|nr:hypothetical protein [Verrucomicrobiae bacterium]
GRVDLQPDRASFVAASGRGVRPPESVLARPTIATRAPVTRALPQAAEGRGPAPHIVPAPRAGEAAGRPPFGESRLERARPPQAPRFDTGRRPDGTSPAPPAARRQDGAAETPRGRTPETMQRSDGPRVGGPRAEPRAPEPARAPQAPVPDAPRAPQGQAPRTPEVRRGPEPSRAPGAPAPGHAPDQTRPPRRETPGPSAVDRPAAPPPRAAAPPQAQQPRKLPGEPANRLYPGRAEPRPAPRAPEPRSKAAPEGAGGHERGPAREKR